MTVIASPVRLLQKDSIGDWTRAVLIAHILRGQKDPRDLIHRMQGARVVRNVAVITTAVS